MQAPEQEALFQRWLRDHFGLILKVVRASAGARHDQDDLLQDVLVNLWSSIPKFRGESKETTWIYRVAFNTALVWRRGETRRSRHHDAFVKLEAPPEAAASASDLLNGPDIVERLYVAIRQLPKVDASLALMHLDGLSYLEMSEVLGISENYIGVKLTRIRKQLADQLQRGSDEL